MVIDMSQNQAAKQSILDELAIDATKDQLHFLDVAREVEQEMASIPACCEALDAAVKSRKARN